MKNLILLVLLFTSVHSIAGDVKRALDNKAVFSIEEIEDIQIGDYLKVFNENDKQVGCIEVKKVNFQNKEAFGMLKDPTDERNPNVFNSRTVYKLSTSDSVISELCESSESIDQD